MKSLSLILALILGFQGVAAAGEMMPVSVGEDGQTQESGKAATIKVDVQKRGTGEKSRVRVILRSGTELKGYISKIDDKSFDVTDRSGKVTIISYTDASKVRGPGLSKGAKIGIVVGVGLAVTAAAFALAFREFGY